MTDERGAGDPARWMNHGTVELRGVRYPLIYGEHPHSRTDNQHYALIDGKPVRFNGYRSVISVTIESMNYLKESHLSGDEIKKGGSCKIMSDGTVVYEFFFRDVQWALLRAHQLIGELSEHSSNWLQSKCRDELVGRPVFYRETPAIVDHIVTEQGCIVLRTADGRVFPTPAWDDNNDVSRTVKVDVLDNNVWWYRKRDTMTSNWTLITHALTVLGGVLLRLAVGVPAIVMKGLTSETKTGMRTESRSENTSLKKKNFSMTREQG